MGRVKFFGKIALTNLIHIPGFYLTAYLSIILFKILGLDTSQSWAEVLLSNLFWILYSFIIFGLPILAIVYLVLVIFDTIAFRYLKLNIIQTLVIEWLIISTPFFYWAIRYEFWMWFTLSASFFVTQLMRKKEIKKMLEKESLSKP